MPESTFTRLPLTCTVARTSGSAFGSRSRIRKLRRLRHLRLCFGSDTTRSNVGLGCGGSVRVRSLQVVPEIGLPAASNTGTPRPGAIEQKRSVKFAGSVLVIVHVDCPPGSRLQSGRYQMCVPVYDVPLPLICHIRSPAGCGQTANRVGLTTVPWYVPGPVASTSTSPFWNSHEPSIGSAACAELAPAPSAISAPPVIARARTRRITHRPCCGRA